MNHSYLIMLLIQFLQLSTFIKPQVQRFMSFTTLGLSEPLLRAIADSGYSTPTPIQLKAIPTILSGKDIQAAAQTGTGKTASFILPLLQRFAGRPQVKSNHIRTLILAPTRELAVQIAEAIQQYGKYLPLKANAVYGGVKINPQMMSLRGGIDILVATPGRLLDLYQQNAVKFSQVEALVLDEADKMLDLGFKDDIRMILSLLPPKRQNLLFSATLSSDIRTLGHKILFKPVQIEVSPRNSTPASLKHYLYEVDKSKKPSLLCHLLKHNDWQQVLVFTRTKKGADQLVKVLAGANVSALAFHGDKSQGARTAALSDFTAGKIRVLVATDIASRGLDIHALSHVINLDLPKVAEDYIHRIGRTGRAGHGGVAISLVSADEVQLLTAIETLLRHLLVREVATGFIPTHSVPLTHLKPPRAKKPKKVKKTNSRLSATEKTPQVQPTTDSRNDAKRIHRKPRKSTTIQENVKSKENSGGRRQKSSLSKTTTTASTTKLSRRNSSKRNRRS